MRMSVQAASASPVGLSSAEAAQRLRSRIRGEARVLRDGHWQRLPASELVAGDAIALRAGDTVPADLRLTGG